MKIIELLETDPYKGMKDVKGTVYLMHLDRPLAHSQHYLGWTNDVDKRETEHNTGKGSPYLRAAKEAGINFKVVRTWPNEDRHFERKLKNRKNARDLCPICRAERGLKTQLEQSRTVNESSLAPLYHTTRIMFLLQILYDNAIVGNTSQDVNDKEVKGISTTRSLSFAKEWGKRFLDDGDYAILVLDQQKLANSFKIIPIDFYTTTAQAADYTPDSEKIKFKNFRRSGERAEAEEFIPIRLLPNLDKYLLNILIPKSAYDDLMHDYKKYAEDLKRIPATETAIRYLKNLETLLKHPKLKII